MVGSGDCGLIEVLDAPAPLREWCPKALRRCRFCPTTGAAHANVRTRRHTSQVDHIGVPGYELFFCTVGGVPIEFMGGIRTRSTSGRATRRTPESCSARPFAWG